MQEDDYKEGVIQRLAEASRESARLIGAADTTQKNKALEIMAKALMDNREKILEENHKDVVAGQCKGLSDALLDRLLLDDDRVESMATGLREIAALDDPVGKITDMQTRPSGIRVARMRVPIGVIGIIYEARPTVTVDAAGLCLKSGNAVILRGGSESVYSNRVIAECIDVAVTAASLPRACIQLIKSISRAAVGEMLTLEGLIDVIIPRGGKNLIKRITDESKIPVIKHFDGICHVYVDRDADLDKALAIVVNSKTQRVGVCNAMETLLVDEAIAGDFLPVVGKELREKGVEIRACNKSLPLLDGAVMAVEEDWDTEYLEPILSIKSVDNLDGALVHIDKHGSRHTDAIVTEDENKAQRFLREVDSSSVMVNASTRFADGFEYGLGAEIGISTNRLHVRGPVGLEGLTMQKFIVYGDGNIRT